MSYAEYGSQIFLPKKYKIDKLFIRNDELAQVKSGCRLKVHDSCWDIRAWSQNHVDNFRYFREVTGMSPPGKILPIEFLLDVLKDFASQDEVEQLRYELEKYKSLKLTPEQEEQLIQLGLQRDNHIFPFNYRSDNITNTNESDEKTLEVVDLSAKSHQTEETLDSKIDELSIDSQDESVSTSITNKYSQLDIESDHYSQEYETKTDNDDTISNEGLVSQRSYSRTTVNENDESLYSSTVERSEFDNDSLSDSDDKSKLTMSQEDISSSFDNQTKDTIIKKEAKLIAFENKLKEKNIELEEVKEFNIKLQNLVQERDFEINSLEKKLESANKDLHQKKSQHDNQFREWKKELSKGTNLIDQLKARHEAKCRDFEIKIEKLRNNSNEADRLRAERDSFLKKINEISRLVEDAGFQSGFEGIETLIQEYFRSSGAERHLSTRCTDQENEITRLTKLIGDIYNDNENKLTKKIRVIDELRAELKDKNEAINNYKEKIALIREESQEAFEEYCYHEDELYDNAFSTYIKRSVEEINEFSTALKRAGDARQQWCDRFEEDKNVYNRRLQMQANEIGKLQRINDDLGKNALIFNDVIKTNSKMKLKLVKLHEDYQESTNDNQIYINELNIKKKKILELKSEKDKLLSRVDKSEATVAEKDLQIEALKAENAEISSMLERNEEKIKNIRKEMNFLNTENENMNQISKLKEEIKNYKKDKQKLEELIKDLREELKNYENSNKLLDKKCSSLLIKNQNLIEKIAGIEEDLSREFEVDIHDIDNFSQLDVIRKSIEIFKKRLDCPFNESKNNLNKKDSGKKLEECDGELTTDDGNKLQVNKKNINNSLDKEEMIESLMREKNELTQKINLEKIQHENKVEELTQRYEKKIKSCVDDHNASVMRLKAQFFQSDQDTNDNIKLLGSMTDVLGNYNYRHISSDNKNPIIMDNEVSNLHCQNTVELSQYTDDSKAKQRYVYAPKISEDKEPIKSATIPVKTKTFMGHCSSIKRSNI